MSLSVQRWRREMNEEENFCVDFCDRNNREHAFWLWQEFGQFRY